jgi:hypothetical protein
MFYQPSSSRAMLREWVQEILDGITFASPDRLALDEITASEVLDLAYLEGSDLSSAIAAHALFPYEVEQQETYRGYGVSSSMEIVFPVSVEAENWGYDITLRAGLPSMLAIGQDRYFPRQEPRTVPPEPMLVPTIGNTRFAIREPNGNRLQVLAGPLFPIERHFSQTITQASGTQRWPIKIPSARYTYTYVDERGVLHTQSGRDGLQPLTQFSKSMPSLYLQNRSLSCSIELQVSWQQIQPNQVRMSITLQNQTTLSQVRESRSAARNVILSALVLPHLKIILRRASAEFPQQQYAQVKKRVLQLAEDERREEAERRLYQVPQSGCITTLSPGNRSHVFMTTFGVFDTPRELPAQGPSLEHVIQSPEELLQEYPDHSEQAVRFVREHWELIRNILLAASQAFHLTHFHQFQWDAITAGIEFEATGRERTVTIVRAPTGAGKTVVFMVNAAISSLCGKQRSTSVLLFPTRILNEDMFRRLTAFVYHLRQHMPDREITGGILMGTSDPLYRLTLNPEESEPMHYYGQCPACHSSHLIAQRRRDVPEVKLFPTCPECGHSVDYMYNPREVMSYLPDIVIATPDKLFYEATVEGNEMYRYGFFGAPVRRCQQCRRAHPNAYFQLKPGTRCSQVFPDAHCVGRFSNSAVSKPIRYMGFDEVHSLYGETATYLSVFLSTLESMQRFLSRHSDLSIRYETATATIANETQLLEAITRRNGSMQEIVSIPRDEQLADYFIIQEDRIRHRVLVTLPSRESSKEVFIRAVLNSFGHLRSTVPDFVADLKERLRELAEVPQTWDFLLGYVFKKQDGYDLRRALGDYFRNRFGSSLSIEFLSGDAPKDQISRILHEALSGQLAILLANMVISLGIDIQNLNHMIMFGVPRGFTEYVQTAGRTGRGNASGHVSVILLPNYPRDVYLYRHFHAILSDVAGYYDVLPVKSTNLYCSERIFGNVARALFGTLCISLDPPDWTHRNGVQKAVRRWESRIPGHIVSLLCNDSTLRQETVRIVLSKYPRLLDEIRSNSGFLGKLMKESENKWLMLSLRGRPSDTVRISCRDQVLLERIEMLSPPAPAQEEESEEIDDDL